MITENLSTLKIHKLSQAQYDRELEAGNIDETALYLTPEEECYTKAEMDVKVSEINSLIESKADSSHSHTVDDIANLQSLLDNKATTFTKQISLDGTTSVNGAWQIGINKWTVSDVLVSDNPFVGIVYNGDDETDENYDNAMTKIRWIRTGDGYIEVYATDTIDVAIPVQIKVVR